MSPSSGDVPRTPDRRSSSSALFGAFRALTGGRIGTPTPPPSITSAPYTPSQTPPLPPVPPSESTTNPPAASADSTIRHDRRKRAMSGSGRVAQGGPPELRGLVAQLQRSLPLSERIAAAHKLAVVLDKYPVRYVLAIWPVASDLFGPEQPDEAVEAAYALLQSLMSLSSLDPVERNVLFQAVVVREDDEYFSRRLEAVKTLTNGGRNVDAVESFIPPFVIKPFESYLRELKGKRGDRREQKREDRREERKDRSGKEKQRADSSPHHAELAQMFQFAVDVCKFNPKVFQEADLESLLCTVLGICRDTTRSSDIENSITLIDTIHTFAHIPPRTLQPTLEILCAIHSQLASLQEQTWNTLQNIFKSHVGQAAVASLLRVLLKGPQRVSREYSTYRAIMQVLRILLLEDGRSGLPTIPIAFLFPALKATIRNKYQSQEKTVLHLIAALLSEEKMRRLLLDEGDWGDLMYIVRTCAEREEDREAAIATHADRKSPAAEKPPSVTDAGSFRAGMASPHMQTVAALANAIKEANGPPASVTSATPALDVDNLDVYSNTHRPTEPARRNADDSLSKILLILDSMSADMDFLQREATTRLNMQLARRLSDSTAENMVNHYVDERLFSPSNGDWLEECRNLVVGILKDTTRTRSLRLRSISILRETYNTVDGLCASDVVLQCAALLLNNIEEEEDVEVLNELVDFAVDVADRASETSFPDTIELLKQRLERARVSPRHEQSLPATSSRSGRVLGSPSNVVTTALVRLFTRNLTTSAQKTLLLYDTLRYIAVTDDFETDARLTVFKLLFRLRADSNHALILSASSEGESIAAVLCRTAETFVSSDKLDDAAAVNGVRSENQTSWRDQRDQRKPLSNSPHSSLNRTTGRRPNSPDHAAKSPPPLWMYPWPEGPPEEPSPHASRVAFAHIDASEYPLSDDLLDMQITLWLELLISLLQKEQEWELYSYVLVHLGPQLSNQALVRSCVPQLKMLRSVVCEQLRGSTFREPPSYTFLKKADVAVCLYHILTVLISYHDYYEKSEEDDIVKVFLHGITHWDRTSKWCIHALSVCCHEMPLSVSKSLDSLIQKMAQIVTKPATAIHILEFLTSLARMPELYKNFREDEFKTVFGVCFRYLQHVRDQRDRNTTVNATQASQKASKHSVAPRDSVASPEQSSSRRAVSAADDLPQYLYSLAYHVITFWFMGLKMDDRHKFVPWITKNLQYGDSSGRQVLEEQGQVIVDMMSIVAYSDRDETTRDADFAKTGDGEVWTKTWIVGNSLITIETAARTGASLITSRRPCGTRYISSRPLLTEPPLHQVPITVGLASDAFYKPSYVGILPDDIFQTFYGPLHLMDPPISLPSDEKTQRAIDAFDRNATVDGYKVGVIYIGEGQTDERDILMNSNGSAAFTSFQYDLGTQVRLKGATFNTGGLDTRNDADGEFTICWRDRCIELVFHIPTLMPTNPDDDMTYPNKKKHIGNDTVNIVFNDSGLPYNFDTFPSAFNYVHIVITPESRASFVDLRLDSDPDGRERYYKVQVISKPGFPDISPAVEPKILCGKHLAAYCRLIAINASVFAQVWYIREGGESISSWRNRLREIKRLRERYGSLDSSAPAAASPSSPVIMQQSRMSSPPSRNDSAAGFNRGSVATFISEGTSRSSMVSSTPDAQ